MLLVLLLIIPLRVLILDLIALGEKIFKLEIGSFFSFSLLCDIDQAHGFDEHVFPSWILLVL